MGRGRGKRILIKLVLFAAVTVPQAQAGPGLWQPTLPVPPQGETSLALLPGGTGYAYHSNAQPSPVLLRTTDFGRSWVPEAAPAFSMSGSIDFRSPEIGFGISHAGEVFRTDDGAHTWQELPRPEVNGDLGFRSLGVATGRPDVLIGGIAWRREVPRGILLASGDGGQTWNRTELASPSSVNAIQLMSSRDGLVLVTEFEPDAVDEGVWQSTKNIIYVTHDGGATLQPIFTCAHRPTPQVCTAVGMASLQRFVIGRNDGATFVTHDGGKTFQQGQWLVSPAPYPPGLESAFWVGGIDFADERTGYASTKGGGTWRTDDGGLTWTREASTELAWGLGIGDIAVADPEHAIAGGPNFVISRLPGL